jgi:hypothetical protein
VFNPGSCSEATTIVAIDGKGKATIYKQHSLVKEKLFAGAKIAVLRAAASPINGMVPTGLCVADLRSGHSSRIAQILQLRESLILDLGESGCCSGLQARVAVRQPRCSGTTCGFQADVSQNCSALWEGRSSCELKLQCLLWTTRTTGGDLDW